VGGEQTVFLVTDLKQFSYCPRIVYYAYCLPAVRPMTAKMEVGIAAHATAKRRERRRTLAAYGLVEGERHFNVWVESEALGLRGRVDLVIETADEVIPVDYKNSRRRVGLHIRRQIAAYGMMVEEKWGKPVRRGFVYSLLTRRAEEIAVTERLRREVRETVAAMREIVERERMPAPPRSRRPCVDCEFRRFCNDVL